MVLSSQIDEQNLKDRVSEILFTIRKRSSNANTMWLKMAGHRISVTAPYTVVEAALAYCGKFLDAVESSGVASSDVDLVVIRSSDVIVELAELPESHWQSHGKWSRLFIAQGNDNLITDIVRAGSDNCYAFYIRHGKLLILVTPEDSGQDIVAIRTIRTLILNRVSLDGALFLHAAGVTHQGQCILLAGPKFAGKTTMMLRLLRMGYGFLTNDKVALDSCSTGSFIAQGFPIAAGIRLGSFGAIDGLSQMWPSLKVGPEELSLSEVGLPGRKEAPKIRVSPSRLVSAFHTAITPTGALRAIFLCGYRPDAEAQLRMLDPEDALNSVRALRLSGSRAVSPEQEFICESPKDLSKTDRLEMSLPLSIPMYQLEYGNASDRTTAEMIAEFLQ